MREFSNFASKLTGLGKLIIALDQRFESAICRHTAHDDCGEIEGCRRSVPYDYLKRDEDLSDLDGYLVFSVEDDAVGVALTLTAGYEF